MRGTEINPITPAFKAANAVATDLKFAEDANIGRSRVATLSKSPYRPLSELDIRKSPQE
jgi:hypothetical protein